MTKNQRPLLLITPSLLNSWGYIWLAGDKVVESEKDEICLEDKKDLARDRAMEEFIKTLNREPIPTNEFMQQGIEYEEETYKGNTDASPYVAGGAFQIVGKKVERIGDIDFLLYGRLDCLKGSIIYDIKRVQRYNVQKYQKSYQHPFYLELFPNAKEFTYLVFDGSKLHTETYYRDNCRNIQASIGDFVRWLKANDLFKIFEEKWQARKE